VLAPSAALNSNSTTGNTATSNSQLSGQQVCYKYEYDSIYSNTRNKYQHYVQNIYDIIIKHLFYQILHYINEMDGNLMKIAKKQAKMQGEDIKEHKFWNTQVDINV